MSAVTPPIRVDMSDDAKRAIGLSVRVAALDAAARIHRNAFPEVVIASAREFEAYLRGEQPEVPHGPFVPRPETLANMLALVADEYPGPPVTLAEVESWSEGARGYAAKWAAAVHLAASDNDVVVPTLPGVLRERAVQS